ncbi:[LSU ribosomal protein L11P]-lysine N-methyltransferase [Natranaerovirga pectinivora]|uniref:Ribosomal protein L11 methyltransferase n=1 Tax=Natranaerovirga pectinivora TaxID=682400 RepID=A0A4R3MUB5_9FIRM|nr:50S ribosomal protein L11 methyltransferase [Natranaerovirga pectinivora]TCT16876.1 [LSU ribosomal protein L11P]-lysine N-methyltransferase [Natranaerovirga pectinivora]
MKWIQYKLKTTPEAVDAISYQLYELGIQGIEIEDCIPLSEADKKQLFVDLMDEPTIIEENTSYIKFYISEEENKDIVIQEIKKSIKEVSEFVSVGEATIQELITDEKDWAENWKKYFKPFKVDENIIVKPSWEALDFAREEDIVIEIDPGMAFGTGTHETTSLCISSINKYMKKNDRVYDIGCGSGILGIAASKLGAAKVVCTDIDPMAVTVASENVQINQVNNNVEVYKGNLLETIDESDKADLVVANILAEVIIILTKDIKKVLKDNGIFICSGIILAKIDDVVKAIEEQGLRIVEIQKKGEWAAIVAQ